MASYKEFVSESKKLISENFSGSAESNKIFERKYKGERHPMSDEVIGFFTLLKDNKKIFIRVSYVMFAYNNFLGTSALDENLEKVPEYVSMFSNVNELMKKFN